MCAWLLHEFVGLWTSLDQTWFESVGTVTDHVLLPAFVMVAESWAGEGTDPSSTSRTNVSQPRPLPAGVAEPWESVIWLSPETSRLAGNVRTAVRGKPLRSACRAIVESLLLGRAPVTAVPFTATVEAPLCCIEVATVR